MVNVEKTLQTLLRKFAEKEDYEKMKIVFWYDKEETADEKSLAQIEDELAKHNIKLKVFDDNFFEIKKLLEVEDTDSNYLIYSSEKEKNPEGNWLLGIQMYSGHFENSRISEIKSVLEINGYDLDKFFEKDTSSSQTKEGRTHPRTISELSTLLDLEHSTVSKALNLLEAAGLIKKEKRFQHVYVSRSESLHSQSLRENLIEYHAFH
ncbi:MAG: MarR family transcriptional regulator [Methanolobus sp.]|jgi:DNA-binding transcriptional ArsR family regulator|nr:MarR family transcriptional regulator [Methanolobus sp.]